SFLVVRDLPQVRVAVQFFEVNRTKLRSYGIDHASPAVDFRQPSLLPSALTTALEGTPIAVGSARPPNLAIPGTRAVDVQNIFSFLDGALGNETQVVGRHFAVNAAINFLESEGLGRSLSAPTLTVLSGETATVAVGGDVPLQTTTTVQLVTT